MVGTKEFSPTIIGSYNRERIAAIVPELQRQRETKRDYVAHVGAITVTADGDELRIAMSGGKSFRVNAGTYATWAEAEAAARSGETIEVLEGTGEMALSRTAARQLCGETNLPLDTVDRFCREGQASLAAATLTQRLRLPRHGVDPAGAAFYDNRRLVRTLDGKCRAILSPSYRILDTVDLFFAAADEFQKVGAEPWQMRLWDDGFQFLAVSSKISGDVRTDRTFDPGDGWESRWANLGGDTQYAAISIGNSETGGGSLNIAPAVMTRVCANFCVWAKVFRGIHIQRSRDECGLISDETARAENDVIWMKVRDSIRTTFDKDKFAAYIDKMNGATQQAIGAKVEETTANVLAETTISDDRKAAILKNLMESRDYSRYGLVQAITFQAHVEDKAGNESIGSDLESIGGDLLDMPRQKFAQLIVA